MVSVRRMDEKPNQEPESTPKKARRGFAAMSVEKQRSIASKGGKASHAKGTGHEWTPQEASVAGRKGGLASKRRKEAAIAGST